MLDGDLVTALRSKDDLLGAKDTLEADLAEALRDLEVSENDKESITSSVFEYVRQTEPYKLLVTFLSCTVYSTLYTVSMYIRQNAQYSLMCPTFTSFNFFFLKKVYRTFLSGTLEFIKLIWRK